MLWKLLAIEMLVQVRMLVLVLEGCLLLMRWLDCLCSMAHGRLLPHTACRQRDTRGSGQEAIGGTELMDA